MFEGILSIEDLKEIEASAKNAAIVAYKAEFHRFLDEKLHTLNGSLQTNQVDEPSRDTRPCLVAAEKIEYAPMQVRETDAYNFINNSERFVHISEIGTATGYSPENLSNPIRNLIKKELIIKHDNGSNVQSYYGLPEWKRDSQILQGREFVLYVATRKRK